MTENQAKASDSATDCYNRGRAKHALGQYEAAIADYDNATRLKPDYALAYYNLGNARAKLGHTWQAQRAWRTALKLATQIDNVKLKNEIESVLLSGRTSPTDTAKGRSGSRPVQAIPATEEARCRQMFDAGIEIAREHGLEDLRGVLQALHDENAPQELIGAIDEVIAQMDFIRKAGTEGARELLIQLRRDRDNPDATFDLDDQRMLHVLENAYDLLTGEELPIVTTEPTFDQPVGKGNVPEDTVGRDRRLHGGAVASVPGSRQTVRSPADGLRPERAKSGAGEVVQGHGDGQEHEMGRGQGERTSDDESESSVELPDGGTGTERLQHRRTARPGDRRDVGTARSDDEDVGDARAAATGGLEVDTPISEERFSGTSLVTSAASDQEKPVHYSEDQIKDIVADYFESLPTASPGYSVKREYLIQMGSDQRRADVVFLRNGKLGAIAECKETRSVRKGIDQLKSYLCATDTFLGIFANDGDPNKWTFWENHRHNNFSEIDRETFENYVYNHDKAIKDRENHIKAEVQREVDAEIRESVRKNTDTDAVRQNETDRIKQEAIENIDKRAVINSVRSQIAEQAKNGLLKERDKENRKLGRAQGFWWTILSIVGIGILIAMLTSA